MKDASERHVGSWLSVRWQTIDTDSPESYAKYPVAEQFPPAVPTVWDDTELVAGDPGKLAVLARRSGADWYVGAIAGGQPSRGVGRPRVSARATGSPIYGDGHLVRTTQRVNSGGALSVPVGRNGGFRARIEGELRKERPDLVKVPESGLPSWSPNVLSRTLGIQPTPVAH